MNAHKTQANRFDPVGPCQWEERERQLLAPYAMFSVNSMGRAYSETQHAYRGPFQRDRDRVLHSAAFRRLSGKMQVFTGEMGDYHRTRLTHTHEVANIARTVARILRLNEDLVEAMALLHDIGHPPYGHSGEDALAECLVEFGGFSHNAFALELVENLETRYTTYPGLNLTREVLAGQTYRITHAGCTPLLEAQVVDLADSITYNAHDVDDALTLGLLEMPQLQSLDLIRRALDYGASKGHSRTQQGMRQSLVHSLIDVQLADLLDVTEEKLRLNQAMDSRGIQELGITLELSPVIASQAEQLAQFLFDNVYRHDLLIATRLKASQRVSTLYQRLVESPQILPARFQQIASKRGVEIAVGHYIGGMTDRFCDAQHRKLVELGGNQADAW